MLKLRDGGLEIMITMKWAWRQPSFKENVEVQLISLYTPKIKEAKWGTEALNLI